ncbi:hypothetical protein QZH41_002298 [Actinostola sp. cb2023]|nr:hypothetical protein QZH41_002298 [Actinostola sp. cb2023]
MVSNVHELNGNPEQKTLKDSYPLPRVDEALEALGGARYFSTLDLTSGYYQVSVDEEDRAKTAFSTPMELYEFKRMPMGLVNAPATFQRLMQTVFGDQVFEKLLICLDDIIVFSTTFEEHLTRLHSVFERLRAHGLKLKPKKCCLVRKEVRYLGHIVSPDGLSTDRTKIEKVVLWKAPVNTGEIRQFLGFAGYYRRFVPQYATLAAPLYRLVSGDPKVKKRGAQHTSLPPVKFEWTKECEVALETLKERLTNTPILAYPDFDFDFDRPTPVHWVWEQS